MLHTLKVGMQKNEDAHTAHVLFDTFLSSCLASILFVSPCATADKLEVIMDSHLLCTAWVGHQGQSWQPSQLDLWQ